MRKGEAVASAAWLDFGEWCRQWALAHPDSELDALDLVDLYLAEVDHAERQAICTMSPG